MICARLRCLQTQRMPRTARRETAGANAIASGSRMQTQTGIGTAAEVNIEMVTECGTQTGTGTAAEAEIEMVTESGTAAASGTAAEGGTAMVSRAAGAARRRNLLTAAAPAAAMTAAAAAAGRVSLEMRGGLPPTAQRHRARACSTA